MSQLIEADLLLMQWARWSSEDMRMLDYVCPCWQSYYDSGYQEESPNSSIPAGKESDMQRVDAALARVRAKDLRHYKIIARVYRHDAGDEYGRWKLDAALRAFIAEYWSDSHPVQNHNCRLDQCSGWR